MTVLKVPPPTAEELAWATVSVLYLTLAALAYEDPWPFDTGLPERDSAEMWTMLSRLVVRLVTAQIDRARREAAA